MSWLLQDGIVGSDAELEGLAETQREDFMEEAGVRPDEAAGMDAEPAEGIGQRVGEDQWAADCRATSARRRAVKREGTGPVGQGVVRRLGLLMGRRNAERVSKEDLVRRAAHLPEHARALATASLGLGMRVVDLAVVHGMTPRQMRTKLEQIRNTLEDPCFMLAVEFGGELPGKMGRLARAYWIECRTMREAARECGMSLHGVRRELATARMLMLISLASRGRMSAGLARAALTGRAGA